MLSFVGGGFRGRDPFGGGFWTPAGWPRFKVVYSLDRGGAADVHGVLSMTVSAPSASAAKMIVRVKNLGRSVSIMDVKEIKIYH